MRYVELSLEAPELGKIPNMFVAALDRMFGKRGRRLWTRVYQARETVPLMYVVQHLGVPRNEPLRESQLPSHHISAKKVS